MKRNEIAALTTHVGGHGDDQKGAEKGGPEGQNKGVSKQRKHQSKQ